MNSTIFTVFKKEFKRFFSDKRMVISTIFLPGILIYVIYTFMGSALTSQFSGEENYKPYVMVANMPESLSPLLSESFEVTAIDGAEVETAKTRVEDKSFDILAVFPENFDNLVASYDVKSGGEAPNIEVYYSSAETASSTAYSMFDEILSTYERSITNKFDVNSPTSGVDYDLSSDEDLSGKIFSSMLPLLLLIFLFSGCIAVAPESIAGEKERGTMATMLVTPVKRSHIALGKIFALSIIALLSGISSAAGVILSLPKLMGGAGDLTSAAYSVTDYLLLGVVILSTVLVLITLISIVSTFAKSTKEAQTYVMPIMILVMVIGVTAMFGSGAAADFYWYLIPLYNTVQCTIGIFSFSANAMFVALTVVSNLVFTALGAFVLTKMFNSEKIMFSK